MNIMEINLFSIAHLALSAFQFSPQKVCSQCLPIYYYFKMNTPGTNGHSPFYCVKFSTHATKSIIDEQDIKIKINQGKYL